MISLMDCIFLLLNFFPNCSDDLMFVLISKDFTCDPTSPNLIDVVLDDNSLFLSKIMPPLVSLLDEVSFLLILFLHIFFDYLKILPIIFAKYWPFEALLLQLMEFELACYSHICLNVINCLALAWFSEFILIYIEF